MHQIQMSYVIQGIEDPIAYQGKDYDFSILQNLENFRNHFKKGNQWMPRHQKVKGVDITHIKALEQNFDPTVFIWVETPEERFSMMAQFSQLENVSEFLKGIQENHEWVKDPKIVSILKADIQISEVKLNTEEHGFSINSSLVTTSYFQNLNFCRIRNTLEKSINIEVLIEAGTKVNFESTIKKGFHLLEGSQLIEIGSGNIIELEHLPFEPKEKKK